MQLDTDPSHILVRVIGIVFMVLAVFLFMFAFILIPHLFWGWQYSVPEGIHEIREWHRFQPQLQFISSAMLIFLAYFVTSILLFIIAKCCGRWLEIQPGIEHVDLDGLKEHKQSGIRWLTILGQLLLITLAAVTVLWMTLLF